MNKDMRDLNKRIMIYPNPSHNWPWWVEYAHGIRPCKTLQLAHEFAMEIHSTKYMSSSIWLRHSDTLADVAVPVPDEESLVLALLSRRV